MSCVAITSIVSIDGADGPARGRRTPFVGLSRPALPYCGGYCSRQIHRCVPVPPAIETAVGGGDSRRQFHRRVPMAPAVEDAVVDEQQVLPRGVEVEPGRCPTRGQEVTDEAVVDVDQDGAGSSPVVVLETARKRLVDNGQ